MGRGKENLAKANWKAFTQASKRVEKYDLINNLAQAPAAVTFGQIARGDTDFAKAFLQKAMSGRLNRSTVTFADEDQERGLSMSGYLHV